MTGSPESAVPSPRGGLLISFGGMALCWAALVTYFLVVPRWPPLRDSGVPSVLIGLAGVGFSLFGLRRSFASRRWRIACSLLVIFGALAEVFLAAYIFYLSYQLPPEGSAIRVGERAPSIRLPDQEGRERTLEEFRGRRLVLVFFRGHW